MVNITLHFELAYLKYVLIAVILLFFSMFLSSLSILESTTNAIFSALIVFWLDKLFVLLKKWRTKIKTHNFGKNETKVDDKADDTNTKDQLKQE